MSDRSQRNTAANENERRRSSLKRRIASVVTAVVVVSGFASLSASPAMAGTAMPDRLKLGERLLQNESIVSATHCYRLTYQNDGNLVIYRQYGDGRAIWASGPTIEPGGQTFPDTAEMQRDGNLVVYWVGLTGGGDWKRAHLWDSHRAFQGGVVVIMQDDGNLVMYNKYWTPLWSSGSIQATRPGPCS